MENLEYSADDIAEALDESINHWKKNYDAVNPWDASTSPMYCALCMMFHKNNCAGCPVSEKTQRTFCSGTPYSDADRKLQAWYETTDVDEKNLREAWRKAAKKELEFLMSLKIEKVENRT